MWIYLPSEFYPSAQELAESSLDLSSQSQLLEQFVMSRSKPLRAKSWLAAWKKKDWMQRLFGRILKPSMASLGVEKWIVSLEDIPASRLVLLEKNLEKTTQDTSGQTSNDSFKKSNHQSASSKMCPTIYELDLKKSQMTYNDWVTKLRLACLQRRKLVLLTKEKDFLSWPTVIVSDHLCNQTETPQRWKERAQEKKLEGINLHKPLRIVAQETWPTVVSADASMGAIISPSDTYKQTSTGSLRKINKNGKDGSLGLARTVKMMGSQQQNWPTVRTSSANGASSKEVEAGNPKQRLEVMITNWATPTTRDWKDSANANVATNSLLGRQAPRSMLNGRESQITLNPRFTEWLMGWPIGWTEFELAETEWCLWLQRMRGKLSRMECILQKTIN